MTKLRLMPKEHWDWSIPVPFSQGWKCRNLIFVGGQVSADASGHATGNDITTQTRNVMQFIGKVLDETGADFSDVVKLNVYYCYKGPDDSLTAFLDKLNAVRREYFTAPGPVTTMLASPALPVRSCFWKSRRLPPSALKNGISHRPVTGIGEGPSLTLTAGGWVTSSSSVAKSRPIRTAPLSAPAISASKPPTSLATSRACCVQPGPT